MQNPGPCAGNVTPRLLQRLAVWAATDNVETATTSSELCSPTHLSKKEAWPRHSSIERAALVVAVGIFHVRNNHCLTNKMFFDYHVASFASTHSKTRQSDVI